MSATTSPKILYLSYDGLTDPLGQSQILPYLCGLSSSYQITIISFEKKDRYASGCELIRNVCSTHQINWLPLVYHKSPPVLSTVYDVFKLKQKVKALHAKQDYSIIHCRSYITSLVGLWMKRTYGVKFIFDMRGFWADERVDGGLWNLKKPIYKITYNYFKKKEQQFVREADHIISLTDNAKKEIISWGVTTPITVIPCCVDVDHFNPERVDVVKQNSLRKSLNITADDFVLIYLGSLGTWYLLNEMLAFFSDILKVKPNAKFLFVTPDHLEIPSSFSKDSFIVRRATRDEVPLYIGLAHASLMFIKPSFSKKASSATKMAEILAMKVPVVTNAGWGDIDYFKDSLSGLAVVENFGENAQAIKYILSQPHGAQIRLGAVQHFSLTKGVALYKNVYSSLS